MKKILNRRDGHLSKTLFVLALLGVVLGGCTAVGPVLSKGDQRVYASNAERSLLLVEEGGEVFDISCLGIEWAKANLGQQLTGRENCEGHTIRNLGRVGWRPEEKDWDMHGYQISEICYPLEKVWQEDINNYKAHAQAWSCVNRLWEIPFWSTISSLQLIGYLPLYLLSLLFGPLHG